MQPLSNAQKFTLNDEQFADEEEIKLEKEENKKLEEKFDEDKKESTERSSKNVSDCFVRWESIEFLRHIIEKNSSSLKKKISYRGKIKLHGTNCAVNILGNKIKTQGRNTWVGEKSDWAHFSSYIKCNESFFAEIASKHSNEHIVIFGEWCGEGINKHAAICEIKKRVFVVFAVYINGVLMMLPEDILKLFLEPCQSKFPPDIYIAPFCTKQISIQFDDIDSNKIAQEYIETLVDYIDREDPWTKQIFGISGTGEGIVWYPLDFEDKFGYISFEKFFQYAFKSKGETHRGNTGILNISLKPLVLENNEEFLNTFATESRFEQGLVEICGSTNRTLSKEEINRCADWFVRDVYKESQLELNKNKKLKWKELESILFRMALNWYTKYCIKIQEANFPSTPPSSISKLNPSKKSNNNESKKQPVKQRKKHQKSKREGKSASLAENNSFNENQLLTEINIV